MKEYNWKVLESIELAFYDCPLAVADCGKYDHEEQPRIGLKYMADPKLEMADEDGYIEFRWQESDLVEMLELLRKHKK
jgi:hypothetical protein